MKFPYRHWSAVQRRFPASLQVANTNFMKNWPAWVERVFVNFHTSILFHGEGELVLNGQKYLLKAPCVFVIYPRDSVLYRASSESGAFSQLYFDFDASYVPELERLRLVKRSNRVWSLVNPARIWALAEELCALSHTFPLENVVDRVDRLCERILIEAQTLPEAETRGDSVIDRVLAKMQAEPQQPFDLSETIRLAHMSEATFRRRWLSKVNISPRRYLEQLRIQTACRLLIETDLPVREIANKLGFDDEFYFSRRFRILKKCSPRAYRNLHKTT